MPVGDPLMGHQGSVLSVAIGTGADAAPLIISGGDDGTIRRWDATTGRPVGDPITGHRGAVRSVALGFDANGRALILSGGEDGATRRWDLSGGGPVGSALGDGEGAVRSVAAGQDVTGVYYIVSGGDEVMRRWNATTGKPIGDALTGHRGAVRSVALCAEANSRILIVSGGADGTVRRWDASTGRPIGAPLTGHRGWVRSIAIGADAKSRTMIVSGGEDGSVRRWDATTGQPIGQAITGHEGMVMSVTLGADVNSRTVIVSGGADATIRRWDATTGQPIGQAITTHQGMVMSLALGADASSRTVIVSGGEDATIRRWDATTGQPIGQAIKGHHDSVVSLAVGADANSRTVIVSGGDDATIRRWDATTGQPIGQAITGHRDSVVSVALGADRAGRPYIASGGDDATIRRWDATTGQPIGQAITSHRGPVLSIAIGTDRTRGKSAVSGGQDGTIRHWILVDDGSEPLADPQSETGALSGENTGAEDALSRDILVQHLIASSDRLLDTESTTRGTIVVQLDGPWGSGKTVLTRLLREKLSEGGQPSDVLKGSALRHPIVVEFDAWRESGVKPPWWALAVGLHRAVQRSRSWPARAALNLTWAAQRIARSPALIWTALAVVVVLLIGLLWPTQMKSMSELLAPIGGVAVAALALSRVLFWSAPVFGQLQHRTDDNPNEEVRAMLTQLRAWTPRYNTSRRWEWTAAFGLALLMMQVGLALWPDTPIPPQQQPLFTVLLLTIAAVLGLTTLFTAPPPATSVGQTNPSAHRPIILIVDNLDRCSTEATVAFLETIQVLIRQADGGDDQQPIAPLVVVVPADSQWVRTAFSTSFKDFSGLGNDAKTLGADFLQKLFEHTVLVPELNPQQVATFTRHVTGLGTQPPNLAPQAAPVPGHRAMSRDDETVDATGVQVDTDPMPSTPQQAIASADALVEEIKSAPLSRLDDLARDNRVTTLSTDDRNRVLGMVVNRQAEPAAQHAKEHLLERNVALLPANPRLIRRIANYWTMLQALKLYLAHGLGQDVLMRAAVVAIQFPTLAELVLRSTWLTTIDAATKDSDKDPQDVKTARALLKRPDVQTALIGPDGPVTLVQLARAYGRFVPDAPATTGAHPDSSAQPPLSASV
ncbi:WD40 repeat [Propioniciclava tarda]|nr:WD40 repeat [Propioniciclava tarda]